MPSKSVRASDEHFHLTVNYCRQELILIKLWTVAFGSCFLIAFTFSPILQTNDLRLPVNFYIPWLSFEDVGWMWLLNYIFQVVTCGATSVYLLVYAPITLVLINQVCLQVDTAILLVKKLDEFINGKLMSSNSNESEACTSGNDYESRNSEVKMMLGRIAEMINHIHEWRGNVQNLMRLNFLVELSALSYSFCSGIFTLSEDVFGSVSLLLTLCVLLCQLFTYCWIGNRLETRVESLSAMLYASEWRSMTVRHQRVLQILLTMSQNIKGIDGVFKSVNLETFQKVSFSN